MRHLGIILDGNRRYAKRLMKKPWKGHEEGAKKVEQLFEWCKEFGIKELTLYCFSIQNFNRPKKEFDYLMELFKEFFERAKNDEKIHESKIKLNFIGRLEMLPEDVREKAEELMEMTKDYSDYKVNFALAYGGREEIIDAIKKLVKDGVSSEEINEELFSNYLELNSDPELIIRTGGERRTSNFLAWQSTYSEWCFLEKPWPEFTKEDLKKCLDDFSERERRFGK